MMRSIFARDEGAEEERRWRMPDLVIIDGGKGQLSAALEVLSEIGLPDLKVVGQLHAGDTFIGIGNQPDRRQPPSEWDT